eukprot:GHVU01196690.1.p3 GENE.GHVU01196690.1~~GHVU01196690.1.p3  ORF type:complete len:102 (-),score=6.78 GHVU01196690.1:785-1090(-)
MHTYTDAYIDAHIHTYTHTYIYMHTRMHACMLTGRDCSGTGGVSLTPLTNESQMNDDCISTTSPLGLFLSRYLFTLLLTAAASKSAYCVCVCVCVCLWGSG